MKGKNIIITGASGGIGGATAHHLLGRGANLLLGYHSGTVDDDTLGAAEPSFIGSFEWIEADLGTAEGCEKLMAAASETFGDTIDGLVNNAGVCVEELLALAEDQDVERMIAVNIMSMVRLTRAALRPMMRRRSGSIVNLSSLAAAVGARGNSVYAGTKGFVDSFTRSVAQEVGPKGIRVNAVAPGLIDTGMTRSIRALASDELEKRIATRRAGHPREVANVIGFALSDEAAYINGATLSVNGGYA